MLVRETFALSFTEFSPTSGAMDAVVQLDTHTVDTTQVLLTSNLSIRPPSTFLLAHDEDGWVPFIVS